MTLIRDMPLSPQKKLDLLREMEVRNPQKNMPRVLYASPPTPMAMFDVRPDLAYA